MLGPYGAAPIGSVRRSIGESYLLGIAGQLFARGMDETQVVNFLASVRGAVSVSKTRELARRARRQHTFQPVGTPRS